MPEETKDPDPTLPGAPVRGLVAAGLVFSVFVNLLVLTGPLFMLQVYDRVLASRSEETLVALFVLVAALYAFYGVLDYARGRVMARAGARLQAAMNARVFSAFLDSAARHPGGRGGAALSDLETIRRFFAAPVLPALFDMPWTPVFLVAIFLFHPLLGWLAVAGGAALTVAALLNQLLTARRDAGARQAAQRAARLARQAEDGGDLVRAQGMGPAMERRWMRLQDDAVAREMGAGDRTGGFSAFSKAFRFLLQSAMLALGAWLVLQNQITAGAMIAASILLGRALAPVEQGIAQWPVVQRARAAWTALKAFLAEMPARPAPTALPPPDATLEVRGVSVAGAAGDRPVLRNVSLTLTPGEALGVIGKSGAGKTTLARVLVGLAEPATGAVRLSGATFDQYGPERFGRYVGYLPQEVRLFDGTVAENIAQMSLAPDPARVVAAARKARVHEIVLQLPDGYDTRLGETGTCLSGGQRQRIALARALYNDPVLLVLDEPNSALDADGSEALNAVVRAMKAEGRGVILMTHRPTAISACDRLLVLEGGQVAGCGPRDEVVRSFMRNAAEVSRVAAAGGGP